ncbi:hypothetical protein [Nonomuraea angiospora]|uniref:hypothetical protein n=1 Tax=Nonomuraea angiospora TaxID=46172 RepID=UPI0029A9C682|nr:hypothetical protein [Nonomuraea angiospora]MDX3099999.1 hypothetical protein [Nonomuraea angiospora]
MLALQPRCGAGGVVGPGGGRALASVVFGAGGAFELAPVRRQAGAALALSAEGGQLLLGELVGMAGAAGAVRGVVGVAGTGGALERGEVAFEVVVLAPHQRPGRPGRRCGGGLLGGPLQGGAFLQDGRQALDVTTAGDEHGRERTIGFNHDIGGTAYRSGGLVGALLPKGKTWWKNSHQLHLWHRELLGNDEQLINLTEPATLAVLVKNGQLSGNVVTGMITFKELEKVSTWMDHSARGRWEAGTKLSYTLTLTSAGLVSRVQSTYTAADSPHGPAPGTLGELAGGTLHVDTRYSRWGSKVSIKAPDPRETTTELCAEEICKLRLPS